MGAVGCLCSAGWSSIDFETEQGRGSAADGTRQRGRRGERELGEARLISTIPEVRGKGQGGLPAGLSVTGDVIKLFPFVTGTVLRQKGNSWSRVRVSDLLIMMLLAYHLQVTDNCSHSNRKSTSIMQAQSLCAGPIRPFKYTVQRFTHIHVSLVCHRTCDKSELIELFSGWGIDIWPLVIGETMSGNSLYWVNIAQQSYTKKDLHKKENLKMAARPCCA